MDKLKYVKLENEDGSYSESIPLAVDSDYVNVNEDTLTNVINSKANIATVNSSINTLSDSINVQKSRIDNLAHLDDGSTTGDAELIDIRVGYDNTSYNNAGDSVRGQINKTFNRISDINGLNSMLRSSFVNEYNTTIYENETEKNLKYKAIDILTDVDFAADHDTFTRVTGSKSIVIPLEGKVQTIIAKKTLGDRLKIAATIEYPKLGSHWTHIHNTSTSTRRKQINVTAEDLYLVVLYYNPSIDTTITEEEVLNTLIIVDSNNEAASSDVTKWDSAARDLETEIETVDNKLYEDNYTRNLYNEKTTEWINIMKQAGGNTFVKTNIKSFALPVLPNSTVTIEKMVTDRFIVYTCSNYPAVGGLINSTYDLNRYVGKNSFTTGEQDNYFVCYCASSITEEDFELLKKSIKVYYGTEWVDKKLITDTLEEEIQNIEKEPWYLDDGLINLCSYRPLGGPLTQGYICLSCDDGQNALVNYTIPKIKELDQTYNRQIPITLGLMNNSDVFKDNEKKAVVQDFLANYGASLAIHGSPSYTSFSRKGLVDFLNEQKEDLTELCGIEPTSIIYPQHEYNVVTATIAGSFYGVCATGGINRPVKYGNMVGPRSNLYTLYRTSLLNSSVTEQTVENWIDTAYEQHLILMPFFHDVDFSKDCNGRTKEQNLALFQHCVEYAISKGLTFVNLGDIPSLI